jgi:NitT/TauT family transport system substrate-binding protein
VTRGGAVVTVFRPIRRAAIAVALALVAASAPATAADRIKIGLLKIPASGPIYVALDKGYFAAEGLDPELVNFEVGVPIPVGVVTGDLDFGAMALIAAFYNLAGQGAVRIIGALSREVPGFQGQGYIVGARLYAQGFTSFKDFPGHSVAVTQMGGPAHYAVGLMADKYHFPLASMRLIVTNSLSNAIAAVESAQADTTVISMTAAIPPLLQRGDVKLLGWVGDETPWQYGALITATRTADNKRDLVERFLRAFRRGARDYHDAFTGPDGRRLDGSAAPALLAILARHTGQPVENVKLSITYSDEDARLDVADVLHQIAWYKAQGMIKGDVDGSALIDRRYVVPLPAR